MRRIAVDIRANHDTGVARYGRSVLRHLSPLAYGQGTQVLAIVREGQEEAVRAWLAPGHEVVGVPGDAGFVRDSPVLRDILAAEDVDLFYTSHYTLDRACPVPFAFTVHDLTRWRFPELSYTDASFENAFGAEQLARVRRELADLADLDPGPAPGVRGETFFRYFVALNRDLAVRAEKIVTVSESTRKDIVDLLAVADRDIVTGPCGVDREVFHPRGRDKEVLSRLGVAPGPYLLVVGLAHPNKRIPWLVEALFGHDGAYPAGSQVVVVGGHADREAEVTRAVTARDDLRLVFTGRVEDEELAALYSGTCAWATASVNEGNNIPPLEAMCCGSEVIATDIAPLRETLGEAAHFYPVEDARGLASLCAQALDGRLVPRGDPAAAPGWQVAASAILGALG